MQVDHLVLRDAQCPDDLLRYFCVLSLENGLDLLINYRYDWIIKWFRELILINDV